MVEVFFARMVGSTC